MFDFDEALKRVATQTILCVGDVMLDDFVYGDVTRISPEAPTPVLAVRHNAIEIGGAGNVARNIATLGARCVFVGLIGDDDAGRVLIKALAQFDDSIIPDLVVDAARQTTRKVRFVSEHHSTHLMRADWETAAPASAASQAAIIARAEAALPKVGAVVLSDYAKGVLTEGVVRAVIDAARRLRKPVIIDPKGHDYRVYRGATLLTPNRKELAAAVHRPVVTDAEVAAAAAELAAIAGCDAVLVKRSEDGMTLAVTGEPPVHVPAYPVKVRDVSGAGDTVAAVMAVLLAQGMPFEPAMRAANAAAAVVVGKRGTATVSLAELRHRILPAASTAGEDKIVFDWSLLDERLGRVAARRPAHRLHQWLFRSPAPRPRPVAGRGARGLRPAHCRPQQRRLDAAAEGSDAADQSGRKPRRSAGGVGSGRPCRRVRGGYPARLDRPRAPGRADQRRRLPARGGGRPRTGRGRRRRRRAGRSGARALDHGDGRAGAAERTASLGGSHP